MTRMSMIESDLKSRIEEEIREIVSRRASEIIEDKLAKTAESPGLEQSQAPVRSVAPTLLEEEIIQAVAAPVRSVPPVAAVAPTVPYASPVSGYPNSAPYSAPPPPYSAPPPAYYSRPPHSFTGPPPPSMMAGYGPSIPPPSMVPSMMPSSRGDAWSGSYVVWPEVPEANLHNAMQAAAPRRSNALLFGIALLALALSGGAFFAKTQQPTASARPTTNTTVGAQHQAPDPAFDSNGIPASPATDTAPAPTLRPAAPVAAANDAPPWSRRYKGNNPMVAPATPVNNNAAPTPKAADAKAVAPVAAAPKPADAKMDQASKTAQLLQEQLDDSVH